MTEEMLQQTILQFQRNEVTEYYVYRRLAKLERDPHNKKVLEKIADDEMRHYRFWLEHSNLG